MRVQIVFLIDTNLENCVYSHVSFANSVCLSCLRLLSYLSARFEKCLVGRKSKQTQFLKWSYKFFDSKKHHTRIESHKMYDFKLRYFEEFENELQRRVDQRNTSSHVTSLKMRRAAENISKAFTEILADFKWEIQELWSPVKGKKLRKDQPDQANLVFLFTKCPKSFLELKEFTGKRVPDEEIFLSSLFPNTLLQQFCKTAKLTLHWIDTQHFTNMNDAEPLALELVKKGVERTGGNVASLHSFARQGCPYFTDIQYLLEESDKHNGPQPPCQSKQFLPLASVIRSLSVPIDSKVLERKPVLSKENKCLTMKIGDKTLEVSLTAQNIKARTQKVQSPSGKSFFPYQSCLLGYAVVKRNCLAHNIPIQSSYLCSQNVRRVTGKNDTTHTEGLFEMLLSRLATRGSIMVLVCMKSGQILLMETLTTHTATLSVLSLDTSLSVEKMLLHQKSNGFTVQHTADNRLCDRIIHRAVDSLHLSKEREVEEVVNVNHFDGQQMGSWVVPGCTKTVQKLVTKLNERISELDFLSADELETLKQLKKIYRAERQPPGLRDTTTCNASSAGPDTKTGFLDKSETLKGKTSQASLSRADKILCKSKEMVEGSMQKKETSNNAGSKADTDRPQLASQLADFENIDELTSYLTATYERTVSGESTDIDSCIQSVTTVALHYFQLKEDKLSAKESCKKLLEDTLLSSGSQLREKYSQTQQLPLEQRISEYETQILLRMEMISTLEEKEKTDGEKVIDEIVGMLRTLSFISEPGLLSKFMQSSFLHNYMHSIPQTLACIYDELMQPLPETLASILSPENTSANQSGFNDDSFGSDDALGGPPSARTRSHGSVEPQVAQPNKMDLSTCGSRGSRKLVHHYSMVDFGSKRQIVVDKVPKKESERSSKKKSKISTSKKKIEKASKSPHKRKRAGVKLQRHQSVAVMQRSHKTPKKNEPSKIRRSAVTPKRHLGKLVAETPCHKQVSSVLNKTLPIQVTMDVVKESPEKACDLSHGTTPTKGKRAKALLRRSFYSAGPTKRTKNLSQYFQLANRIAGRQPQPSTDRKKQTKLISFETPDHFKSPDKNSSFLLSQLGASPSPAKATPRKTTRNLSKVLDSPCHNTRSKVCESPTVDILRCPGSGVSQASPVAHFKQKSFNRQQSPQILAAESGVIKELVMSQTTPEKSPALGAVTFGLDSPSQNTRQRLAQTPTRRSVRAALFAKSPVTRNHSPYRATASPRTLLDKFGSPVKTGSDKYSQKHRGGSCIEKAVPSKSKCAFQILESTSAPAAGLAAAATSAGHNSRPTMISLSNKINIVKPSDDEKPLLGSKTPSPSTKRATKTPDSFDKWRRVKPRMSQKSPVVKSNDTAIIAKPLTGSQNSEINVLNRNLTDGVNLHQNDEYKVKGVKGSCRKKRCLLQSPEKSVGSFSKRLRTANDSFVGSQGFDVTGSLTELSQISSTSSVDYFSAMNDDVFLSQDAETLDIKDLDMKTKRRLLESNGQGDSRSQSPVFGCSIKRLNVTQPISAENFKECSQKNSVCESDSGHISPVRVLKSPATKKYSPNVSAKSLMHLIQSPLLHSPDGRVGKKASKMLSPSSSMVSPKSKVTGGHSRRSLKLHN